MLAQIGVAIAQSVPPKIDETPHTRERPSAYASRMAYEKAQAVLAQEPKSHDAVLIAADTVVSVGARILPKAETETQARDCLRLLSGRAHRVYTALCIVDCNTRMIQRRVMSRLKVAHLGTDEIKHYLASKEWHGKAGGYAIQGRAAGFIHHISGSYSAIVGLPLFETARILKGIGVQIEAMGENPKGQKRGQNGN